MTRKTLSQVHAHLILEENKDGLDLHQLGFITTVLKDNETNDQLHDYYQAVLKLIYKHLN